MIDDLREEEIVNKVGGRFKLSTLIQKRLVALNAGGRPLVDIDSDDKIVARTGNISQFLTNVQIKRQKTRSLT